MSLPEVDNIDEDEIENESPPPIGLPGRRPARRRTRDVPELDVVKMFFDAFVVVRDRTTPNTAQARRLLEGFSTPSVLALFSSVFVSAGVRSNGAHVAVSKSNFGRALSADGFLPAGAQVLAQQFVGIVNENGDVVDKRQRKVLTGVRFVSTEEELGVCANKLFEMPKDVFNSEFLEVFESADMPVRDKTKKLSKMLKQRIQQHVERVRGTLAQTRVDRVPRDPGANAAASQPQTIVQRKNTGEVINDETAGGEMVVEYLRSRGRLREEDVEDFLTCRCLRTTPLLHALVKQANALYESHPEWHVTVDERRDMLRRERREGISETQMDTAAQMDARSEDEDTEMEHFDDDIDRPNFNSSESGIARANKDLSGRQRTVLQDIVNEFRVGGLSD